MIIDFSTIDSKEIYKLMSQNIIPRPIAWIVTENKFINVAPFSYFTGVSSKPPLLMVSIGRNKKGLNEPKDTFKNIKETKKCSVCLVSTNMANKVEKTKEELPFGISEAEKFNIELQKIEEDFPPIIKGCNIAFFTTLYGTFENDEMATVPFFLKIEKMYYEKDFNNPLARIGSNYAKICEI